MEKLRRGEEIERLKGTASSTLGARKGEPDVDSDLNLLVVRISQGKRTRRERLPSEKDWKEKPSQSGQSGRTGMGRD